MLEIKLVIGVQFEQENPNPWVHHSIGMVFPILMVQMLFPQIQHAHGPTSER